MSLGEAICYNMFGQTSARIISFGINMYFLRVIDSEVLGTVNVQLFLLYNTILFLSREPARKANITQGSIQKFVNILWLSPVICGVLCLPITLAWKYGSSTINDLDATILLAFPLSAFIESLAEPFAVISLKFSLNAEFAIGQSLLIFLQRLISLVFIVLLKDSEMHMSILCYSQVVSSLIYLVYYWATFFIYSSQDKPELAQFKGLRSFFPSKTENTWLDAKSSSAYSVMFGHSIFKQIVTDGSGYIMTFTKSVAVADQAVFDAIERLGSVVARIVLTPLEENCHADFSRSLHRNPSNTDLKEDASAVVKRFITVLHVVTVIGSIICVFGAAYSGIAVQFYGGKLLRDNNGGVLLAGYSFYILVMAINGITECFAMASMNNKQITVHGTCMLLLAILHMFLNGVFSSKYSSLGFIYANILTMLLRIVYSWRHILNRFHERPSILETLPTLKTLGHLTFCFAATQFSRLIFNSDGLTDVGTHLVVGATMFFIVSSHIYHYDFIIQSAVDSLLQSRFANNSLFRMVRSFFHTCLL